MALLLLLYLFVDRAKGGELHAAPMVGYSTRHFRHFARLLNADAVVWTEMVKVKDLLSASSAQQAAMLTRGAEHELAISSGARGRSVLQLGGDDPDDLRRSCELASSFHHDAYDLNCGCPSIETNAHFGATLMRNPAHVLSLVDAMAKSSAGVPVTVKCRIGTRETYQSVVEDKYETLYNFVNQVTSSGTVRQVVIHARSAVLQGLDPAKNRCVPPLRYDFVYAVARDFPQLKIVLNGGITSVNSTMVEPGSGLAGVMLGRHLLRRPLDLLLHQHGGTVPAMDETKAERALEEYSRYAARESLRSQVDPEQPQEVGEGGEGRASSPLGESRPIDMILLRRLKLVTQLLVPLLSQASSSASIASSLRAAAKELDAIDEADVEGGGRDYAEEVGDVARRVNKAVKAVLGKKIVGKIRANTA